MKKIKTNFSLFEMSFIGFAFGQDHICKIPKMGDNVIQLKLC